MIETNYRVLCASSDPPVVKAYEFCNVSQREQEVPEDLDIKTLVMGILDDNGFAEKRARTLDVDDFLRLLALKRTVWTDRLSTGFSVYSTLAAFTLLKCLRRTKKPRDSV